MKNNIVIVLIFLVNLIGLYLIIDLANYDEATGALTPVLDRHLRRVPFLAEAV